MTFYTGRPVLVIGGLGFIGANLTARLLDLDAKVTVVTPRRERHAEQAASFATRGVTIIEGDVRDPVVIGHHIANQQIVFNLSGQSGAVRSMEDPFTDLDVNLRGNLVVLEAMREVNPEAKLVLAGSRLQYGRVRQVPVSEHHTGEPLCLHAIHKQAAEEYLQLYARLFGLRSSMARVTNPFGPGQPSGRTTYGIINRLIHLALAGESLTIYGNGSQLRDYIYIDDVIDALLLLGASDSSDGRVYNVGSGAGTRMVDVAQMIVEIAGRGVVQHVPWPPLAEQIETGDFVADISRIQQELGWRPRVPLGDGLEQTVAFYRAHVAP